ncbi:Uncharacterised protein [Vibrio cholerae]|nr:Uncharacterised protein [Vibrio cholerae]
MTVPLEAFVSFVAHCLTMILRKQFYAKASNKRTSSTKSCEVNSQNSKHSRLSWPR